MLKTSRALSSEGLAFRIENKVVNGEVMFDLIWQANGEEEELAMLCDYKDLILLEGLIMFNT
jgi:hypothetical protein